MAIIPSPLTIISFIWGHIFEIIIIGVLIIIIFAIFFRRYLSAIIYDYVVDGGLSFADNFIAGAGLIGLDIGDWIAAFLIYRKEGKISGGGVAMLAAWEATNFLPLSFIPVFGEILEVIFNLFPAVFISRVLFNKYRPAESQIHKTEKLISIAERYRIGTWKAKRILKKAKESISGAKPVEALKLLESKKPDKEISSELTNYVNGLISQTNGFIQNIVNQNVQAPQELINMLQGGINESGQLLQQAQGAVSKQDFETAINLSVNANNIITSAAQQFDNTFQEYQNQLQTDNTNQYSYRQ